MKNIQLKQKFYLVFGSIQAILLLAFVIKFTNLNMININAITNNIILALLIIIPLAGILLGRNIIQPMNEVLNFSSLLAGGDNPEKLPIRKDKELGTLANNLNAVSENIRINKNYLDNLPTPVVAIDKEFNVIFMNKAGANVLQKNKDFIIGEKCYNLFKTTHCNTGECRCMQAMTKDNTFTGQTVSDLPSGKLPIQYTGSPIKDDNGKIIGALEYVTDISNLKNVIEDSEQYPYSCDGY